MKYLTLNKIFAAYVVIFVAVVGGFIPRETIVYVTAFLLAWTLLAPLEQGTLFFIRSIPLFVAIPLTATYDNLTMWRPLALVLIGRLLWQERKAIITEVRAFFRTPAVWLKAHPVFRRLIILLVLAGLSLIGAMHPSEGIKRIIYFVNLSMVPIVVYTLLRRGTITTRQMFTSLAIPTITVIVVGFIQLISTYLIDVYQFMRLWGEGIQLRQFGQEWSYIAVWKGNTWLAYYGSQLSLRVFSLFPDSHSFPTFVLLGIPALMAMAFDRIVAKTQEPLKRLMHTRASWSVAWIPLGLLGAILSGTRGIWAASVGVVMLAILLMWLFKRWQIEIARRRIFAYVSSYLLLFFMLFTLAWPIFVSPQFLLGKGDWGLLGGRIRSIVDFGETSNALRLKIWKASVVSIGHHPFLGVGIGNFPVVLDQDISLARAGSTAHNLYLHVAAEMGIPAALEMIVLLAAAWYTTLQWFRRAQGPALVYSGALLLYLPWVLAYVLTDPIIFDERVFLMFATTLAIIWSSRHD